MLHLQRRFLELSRPESSWTRNRWFANIRVRRWPNVYDAAHSVNMVVLRLAGADAPELAGRVRFAGRRTLLQRGNEGGA